MLFRRRTKWGLFPPFPMYIFSGDYCAADFSDCDIQFGNEEQCGSLFPAQQEKRGVIWNHEGGGVLKC